MEIEKKQKMRDTLEVKWMLRGDQLEVGGGDSERSKMSPQ